MAKPKPIKLPAHTIELSDDGFLGYVHARCIRDADGKEVANVSISRLNYQTDRAHRAAIKKYIERDLAARTAYESRNG